MSDVTARYAEVDELRERFSLTSAAGNDNDLDEALYEASRWIDDQTHQTRYGFTSSLPGTVETLFDVTRSPVPLPAPLVADTAITQVTSAGKVLDPASYQAEDLLLLHISASWATPLAITATWGWQEVPSQIKRATLLTGAAFIIEGSDTEALTMRSISTAPEAQATQYKLAAQRYMERAAALLERFTLTNLT